MLSTLLNTPEEILYQEKPIPVPKEDEVLIKVRRVGVCGSDIHAYYGKHPTVYLPLTLGHEFCGIIESVGENAKKFNKGDFVTVRPQYTCGKCVYCKTGHENICKELIVIGDNNKVDGGCQEYIAIKENRVYALPEDKMDFDDGAMVEPVAVAFSAVRRFHESIVGKNILVCGAGTIGNLVAQAAKAEGAKAVLITDLCQEKLDIAKKSGIDYICNTGTENLLNVAETVFGTDGIDGALECVGIEATVNDAINVCRKGDEIIIVGVYGKRPAIDMINVQEKELVITGTLMYLAEDYERAIKAISDKEINLEPLKTIHFDLKEYGKAYKYIEQHKETSMKVLINVNEE